MNYPRKVVGSVALLTLLATACSSSTEGGSGTTGRAISLKTQVQIDDDYNQAKTNALGWAVTLTQAYLSIGALYYYSGDPVLAQSGPLTRRHSIDLAWLGDFFVKPALAHPGHYIEGAAMGQMLKPTSIDLLGESVRLADGDGVTGMTNSARFMWQSPPEGELASKLEGHVVLTQGVATKGDLSLRFIAKADESDVLDGDGKAEVAGCAFGEEPGAVGVDMDGDGTVTLTLVPSVWFDQVDFDYVASAAPDTTRDPNGFTDIAGTLAWKGFIRGVKKGTAYQFSYSK